MEVPKIVPIIEDTKLSRKAALIQQTMGFLANLTIISSGMGIGFPAITLELLTGPNQIVKLTESQGSWFASITAISSLLGGLIAGYLLDKIGRKKTLVSINIISMISWIIIATSSNTNSDNLFLQLMIGRVVIGIGIGMSGSPASVYSAEICHPDLRGRLTLLSTLCTALGMLFIYLLGYFVPTDWRLVSWYACGFTMLSMIFLYPIPESPTYLVGKNKLLKARKSIRIIRDYDKDDCRIDNEIKKLQENSLQVDDEGKVESKWHQLKRPELYKPLCIMMVFFGFQQFSGCFVTFIYSAKVSTAAGVSIDPFLCTVFIGLTRVLTTACMALITDKVGRKPLGIISGFGMSICMFGLAACVIHPLKGSSIEWIPVVLFITFIFSATLGFLSLPFAMLGELYPQKSKGFATGLTIFAAYGMSFINIKMYPTLSMSLGNDVIFIFFGIVSAVGIFFVYFFLPETKGKTLLEIENHFRGESNDIVLKVNEKYSPNDNGNINHAYSP